MVDRAARAGDRSMTLVPNLSGKGSGPTVAVERLSCANRLSSLPDVAAPVRRRIGRFAATALILLVMAVVGLGLWRVLADAVGEFTGK